MKDHGEIQRRKFKGCPSYLYKYHYGNEESSGHSESRRVKPVISNPTRKTVFQVVLFAALIVSVSALLPRIMPMGIWLGILAMVVLCGGFTIGRLAVVISPLVVAAIGVRAELVAATPLQIKMFLLGGSVILVMIVLLAAVGHMGRTTISLGLNKLRKDYNS